MADTVNLKKAYSLLNERLITLFDGSGVKRSLTVPYVNGQSMADHTQTVSKAVQNVGGLGANLLLTAHHSDGKGWGSGDGHTVAHPSDKLRSTIIPKDDEKAKAVIDAAQKYINGVKKLLGEEEPAVQVAQGQLNLVKKTEGQGMTLLDFGIFMTQMVYAPTQAVAKAHSGSKPGGHSVRLRAAGELHEQEAQQAPGEAEGAGAAGEAPNEAEAAPAAPGATAGAPEAAPAAAETPAQA